MKVFFKALLGLGVTTMLINCDGTTTIAPDAELQSIGSNFNAVSTNFTLDLWKKVDQNEGNKNYFVSPLSLHTALGMLLNGSNGNTTKEIKSTLKLDNLDETKINDTYSKIMANFEKIDSKVTSKMVNSIWYREGFPFSKSYLDQNNQVFKASINPEDFSPTTVGKINKWASDNTNRKIEKVIDSIQDSDVMFLMNALYFKGDWKTPFDTKRTEDEDFVGISGAKKVKMMNLKDNFGYISTDAFSALELPYGSEKFNMVLILPKNEKTPTSSIINAISSSDWSKLTKLNAQKVNVKLPRFTLNYEIKLNDILKSMGMKEAFDANADWSKMASNAETAKKLKLSFVKQNAFIGVDEKGTEAAAVTTIGVGVTSAGPIEPEFYCNRPFLFAIHEKTSGQILFIGKISDL